MWRHGSDCCRCCKQGLDWRLGVSKLISLVEETAMMVFVGHVEVYCKLFVCQALQHLAVNLTGTEFVFALPEV